MKNKSTRLIDANLLKKEIKTKKFVYYSVAGFCELIDSQPTLIDKISPRNSIPKGIFNKKWKWIARDENGDLYVFEQKPVKKESVWRAIGDTDFELVDNDIFDFATIKFKDKYPTKIGD